MKISLGSKANELRERLRLCQLPWGEGGAGLLLSLGGVEVLVVLWQGRGGILSRRGSVGVGQLLGTGCAPSCGLCRPNAAPRWIRALRGRAGLRPPPCDMVFEGQRCPGLVRNGHKLSTLVLRRIQWQHLCGQGPPDLSMPAWH